jgi:hypothetical protein
MRGKIWSCWKTSDAGIYSNDWEIIGKAGQKPANYDHLFGDAGFLPISSSIADSRDLDF